VTAEDPHRGFGAEGTVTTLRAPLAVQEALDLRQEGDELVVVSLVEALTIAGVLVDHLAPGRI
jgi:hypothetical protein